MSQTKKILETCGEWGVLIAAFYSFVMIFFGIDFSDSFYYIERFRFDEIKPMIILFQLIGCLHVTIFGETIIALRIANWLFYAASFLLVFYWFVPNRYKCFLMVPFLLLPTLSLNIYNGDSLTLLLLVLFVRIDSLLYKNWNLKYAFLETIILISLILARFPNVVLIIFWIVLKLIFEHDKKSIIRYIPILAIVISVCSFVYFVLYKLGAPLFGSDTDEGHSFAMLMKRYLDDLPLYCSSLICTLFSILLAIVRTKNRIINFTLAILSATILIVFMLLKVPFSFACWDFATFVSGFFSAFLIVSIVINIVRKQYSKLYLLLLFFAAATIPPAGSDTGFLKFAWLYMVISSFALYTLYADANQTLQHINGRLSVIFKQTMSSLGLVLMVIVVSIAAIVHHYNVPFEEPPLNFVRYSIDSPYLKGIRTSSSWYCFFNSVKADINEYHLDDKPVIFYGQFSHGFYKMLNINKPFKSSYAMRSNNKHDLDLLLEKIDECHPAIFFVPGMWGEIDPSRGDRLSIMEQLIQKRGYKAVCQEKRYIFYLYQEQDLTEIN